MKDYSGWYRGDLDNSLGRRHNSGRIVSRDVITVIRSADQRQNQTTLEKVLNYIYYTFHAVIQ